MVIQNGSASLILAAADGHASVVTLLLDAKADVNHVDEASCKQKVVWCAQDTVC